MALTQIQYWREKKMTIDKYLTKWLNIIMTYFTKQTRTFFSELADNNTKTWFKYNKERYEQDVLQPAIRFVENLGQALRDTLPNLKAIPKIDQSIFRLHRDVRFGTDKRPYKTQLAILLWEGTGHRMQCPGAYFQLDDEKLIIGGGCHQFNPTQLTAYRNTIVMPSKAAQLSTLEKSFLKKDIQCLGQHYKRFPKGYLPIKGHEKWLLHNGLYIAQERLLSDIKEDELFKICVTFYKQDYALLHEWIKESVADVS